MLSRAGERRSQFESGSNSNFPEFDGDESMALKAVVRSKKADARRAEKGCFENAPRSAAKRKIAEAVDSAARFRQRSKKEQKELFSTPQDKTKRSYGTPDDRSQAGSNNKLLLVPGGGVGVQYFSAEIGGGVGGAAVVGGGPGPAGSSWHSSRGGASSSDSGRNYSGGLGGGPRAKRGLQRMDSIAEEESEEEERGVEQALPSPGSGLARQRQRWAQRGVMNHKQVLDFDAVVEHHDPAVDQAGRPTQEEEQVRAATIEERVSSAPSNVRAV